ncbi:BspA family leucine-rich repeat surface protein [Flavobacteriaceae bacterium]|nr:BspA family leucine-rich repeat surface protein [Flavobacteriaceae bacterium]
MSLIFKFYSNFNEDISSWDVSNVTACDNFSMGAYSWTLPQPNFTNCTP